MIISELIKALEEIRSRWGNLTISDNVHIYQEPKIQIITEMKDNKPQTYLVIS